MESKFFLSILLFVTAAALAVAGAGAEAATTVNGSFSSTQRIHIGDNTITADACPTASQDTTNECGHIEYAFNVAGTFAASVTVDCNSLPASTDVPCGAQMVTPSLCQEGQPGPPSPACPATSFDFVTGTSEQQAPCDETDTPNKDGSITYTISNCPVTPGNYELLLAPNFVDTCPTFNPLDMSTYCDMPFFPSGPGLDVIVAVSFSPGVTTSVAQKARVSGGGVLSDSTMHFALKGFADMSKWSHSHLRFMINTKDSTHCTLVADAPYFVSVSPSLLSGTMKEAGGSAEMDGYATLKDSSGAKSTVQYKLNVTDGGKDGGDTFELTNVTTPGSCDTRGAPMAVAHGNIDVDPDSPQN